MVAKTSHPAMDRLRKKINSLKAENKQLREVLSASHTDEDLENARSDGWQQGWDARAEMEME